MNMVSQVWISQGLPSGAVPEGHQGEPDPRGDQPGDADADCQEHPQQVGWAGHISGGEPIGEGNTLSVYSEV